MCRLVELLKQAAVQPAAGRGSGRLDLPRYQGPPGFGSRPRTSRRFDDELLEHVKASHADILKGIKETKKLSEEAEEKLVSVINEFKKGFSATDGSSVVVNEADADALDPEDLEKESVKVRKPAPKKA